MVLAQDEVPPLQQISNQHIMDAIATNSEFSNFKNKLFHCCRLYLHVVIIANISNISGTCIPTKMLTSTYHPCAENYHIHIKKGGRYLVRPVEMLVQLMEIKVMLPANKQLLTNKELGNSLLYLMIRKKVWKNQRERMCPQVLPASVLKKRKKIACWWQKWSRYSSHCHQGCGKLIHCNS